MGLDKVWTFYGTVDAIPYTWPTFYIAAMPFVLQPGLACNPPGADFSTALLAEFNELVNRYGALSDNSSALGGDGATSVQDNGTSIIYSNGTSTFIRNTTALWDNITTTWSKLYNESVIPLGTGEMTFLQCDLFNATYQVEFDFVDGLQNITAYTELVDDAPLESVGWVEGPNSTKGMVVTGCSTLFY